ncbi:MAG: IclR family transcriptional regulator, partial [Carbonactinosporaceae bacterium]
LAERTEENAELHVRRAEARVPIEVVSSSQNLRPIAEMGGPLPLHVGASGKVLLAWLRDAEQAALAAASAARFPEVPASEADALHSRLASVRRLGWADSDGERSHGVAAVSAPIFEVSGEVGGAVVVSGPSSRLCARRRREIASLVVEAAARTSRDAGYQPGSASQRHEEGF